MTPSRWERVKEIYESALERPVQDRAPFVDGACGRDTMVRQEVLRLLSLEPPSDFLQSPAGRFSGTTQTAAPPAIELSHWRHLEIRAEIGKGGFGRVFEAWDPKLNREVALKLVSMSEVAAGSSREAQRLARLRHSNIVTVHGADAEEGYYGLWMELIRGQTLQQILNRQGAYGPREAALVGIDICQALAAVHGAGLLHRDIKAQNVMREEGGRIVLMDFGLGKEFSAGDDKESTAPAALSAIGMQSTRSVAGMPAGTPAYMAPELLSGKPATVQSDIYSVGILLYHLLTNAYPGVSFTSSIGGGVVNRLQSLHDVRPDLPWGLVQIVERAMNPDPAARFASAGQVLAAISAWLQTPDSVIASGRSKTRARWKAATVAGAIGALVLGFVTWRILRTPPHSEPVFQRITSDTGFTRWSTLSADGKVLAYASDRSGEGSLDIWIQNLPDGTPVRLTSFPEDEYQPALSPDGRYIAYRSEHKGGNLYLRPVISSGEDRVVASGGFDPRFSPDGSQLVFWTGEAANLNDPTGKIFVVSASGGTPRQLEPDFADARYPVWSPDGKRILFQGARSSARPPAEEWDWWIADLGGSAPRKTGAWDSFRRQQLALVACPPSWTGDSIVFGARFGHSTDIWSVPISPLGVQSAAPERITTGSTFAVDPWSTQDGRVFYTEQVANVNIFSIPLEPARGGETLKHVTANAWLERRPTISEDGKKVAFTRQQGSEQNIYVRDSETGNEAAVAASPDVTATINRQGTMVGWSSFNGTRQPVYAVPVTGGAVQTLCEDCGELLEWTPDGHGFLYAAGLPKRIFKFDLSTKTKTLLAGDPSASLDDASLSRSGQWLAFVAKPASGNLQIFVAKIADGQPAPRNKWIQITGGATQDDKPRWSPDGQSIFFVSSREGLECIWKQRLLPRSMLPAGAPVAFQHLHNTALSMQRLSRPALNLSIGSQSMVFNLGTARGNIWVVSRPK